MNKCLHLLCPALAAFFLLLCTPSFAQSPNQQFGIGGTVGASTNLAGVLPITGGGAIYGVYAISPTVHIAAVFDLTIVNVEDVSATGVGFGVSGKFFLGGSGLFHPYARANFSFSSVSIEGASRSDPAFSAGVGAEYFANRNFGAFLGISIIAAHFGDESSTIFGIGNPYVGMEWFF